MHSRNKRRRRRRKFREVSTGEVNEGCFFRSPSPGWKQYTGETVHSGRGEAWRNAGTMHRNNESVNMARWDFVTSRLFFFYHFAAHARTRSHPVSRDRSNETGTKREARACDTFSFFFAPSLSLSLRSAFLAAFLLNRDEQRLWRRKHEGRRREQVDKRGKT